MSGSRADGFRYERKFTVDQLDVRHVQAMVKLHPAMFVQPYPPRFVNNIYLDSPGLENYADNVRGVDNRLKVRVRWYGELFGQIDRPVLEFKVKRGLVGTKESYPLAPLQLGQGFTSRYLRKVLQASPLPDPVRVRVRDLNAVLLNRYYRWYFATVDGRYRVTIDARLAYHHVGRLRSRFAHRQVDYRSVIVELKYGAQHEGSADKVASVFPFRVTKNSKYVQGIERVYP